MWDDIPRSDIVLGGDSIWPLAASRYGEEDISTQNLLHLHDPLLTSTMVTAGDEAEQVNDLLFDELERITISNHSPSPQLDLGIVSSFLFAIYTRLVGSSLFFYLPASKRIHQR